MTREPHPPQAAQPAPAEKRPLPRWKLLLILFWTMCKIGLFTFGGGYAMIALLEAEVVGRRQWLSAEEFLDMTAISESTPGSIAVNAATYIGYKLARVAGAAIATVAVCLPSFAIIYAISLFFNAFLEIEVVAWAFEGIQICVVFLILAAGIRMLKQLERSAFNIVVLVATAGCMLAFGIFAVDFSSIFYILIAGAAGVAVYLIRRLAARNKQRNKKEGGDDDHAVR